MNRFRAAAIQMPTVEDKMENIKAVRHYLEQIKAQKVDFVVLPEMSVPDGKIPGIRRRRGRFGVESSFCICERI